MTGQLILITGGNGHVGFKVVLFALQAGYRVRAAVRSQEKADKISDAASLKALGPVEDRLSFVFVPDMLVSGAYDEAVKGVDYAIHIASPISERATDDDYDTTLIQPAIRGTLNFLEAAKKSSSIKRVVITSSVVALMNWNEFFVEATDKVFNERSRVPNPTGPYSNNFEAYLASKVIALNAAEQWKKEHNPDFTLVHVHPAFVLGRDETVTTTEDAVKGTNGTILSQVLGKAGPPALPGATIYLDDTAMAHIEALNNSIPDGQSLVTSLGVTWAEAVDVVAKHFPEAVASGVLPNNAPVKTKALKVDTTETQKLIGHGFKPFEDQVVDIVAHYLQLKGLPAA